MTVENSEQQANEFEVITIGEYPFKLRDLCASDEDYELLSGWLNGYARDIAAAHNVVVSSLQSEVSALKSDVSEMEAVRSINFDLELRCNDLEAKRDAAATELESAQEEVRRITADNNALRSQIEAANKPVSTNITADINEIARKRHEAKPAIYNKRWADDIRRTHYVATLVETGDEITFGHLEGGKYREVTEEEAERFRAEAEAKRIEAEAAAAMEENHADSPLVDYPTPPTIPSEETDTQLQGGAAGGALVSEEFEARLAEVERRLQLVEERFTPTNASVA